MVFGRDKPAAARDFSELTGDPFATGLLNDAPDPAERQRYATQYDQNVEAALARAGVLPDHPEYDRIYRDAINGDMTLPSGDPMEHGHELPMTKRDALLFAPETMWRTAQEQGQRGEAMLAEYFRRNGDLRDREGLNEAVAAAQEYYDERGLVPSEHVSDFLNTCASFHRGGVGPIHASADSGRTSGIGSGSGTYRPDTIHPDLDDDQGLVGDLRAIQKARGW